MLEFNNPNQQNSPGVIFNFVSSYLAVVWGIEEKLRDPTQLMAYGVYLTQVRVSIKNEINESLSIITNKQLTS
jgi:hypothetical protein